jgi:hypothetical protein
MESPSFNGGQEVIRPVSRPWVILTQLMLQRPGVSWRSASLTTCTMCMAAVRGRCRKSMIFKICSLRVWTDRAASDTFDVQG